MIVASWLDDTDSIFQQHMWGLVLHDFWCQVAIAALLHYGATFGGLYDDDYDSYKVER